MRMTTRSSWFLVGLVLMLSGAVALAAQADQPAGSIAIVGATVIDGKFVTPGFIDTNVHISLYSGIETLAKYSDRNDELALEGAQMQLKFGITTIRDSYGTFRPLVRVRDAIAAGTSVGPRMLVAGNIVGWGGSYSVTFRLKQEPDLTLLEEMLNDSITEGTDEELMDMYPDELRSAINRYLDKGPDFIKYGGTSHWSYPTLIGFSPRSQQIIVEETHKRGLVAETHATNPEGLLLAVQAGIDLIQHPEFIADREMSEELVREITERGIICSMLTNTYTGKSWEKEHLEKARQADERKTKKAETDKENAADPLQLRVRRSVDREKTAAERGAERRERGYEYQIGRRNAEKLIRGGCIVTVGTDNYLGTAPEFERDPKPLWQEPGIGTLIGIEGLVELGMTPAEAIVSATRNGALACKALEEFGTLEPGKLADLVVLEADPLADISNIRRQALVMKEGRIIDTEALPTSPIFYTR